MVLPEKSFAFVAHLQALVVEWFMSNFDFWSFWGGIAYFPALSIESLPNMYAVFSHFPRETKMLNLSVFSIYGQTQELCLVTEIQ